MVARSVSRQAAGRRTRPVLAVFRRLAMAFAVRRHRLALSRLDPRLLKDIGLTEPEARDEIARPLWDVPSHWRE